jgi:hypothetical protein
MLGHIAGSAKKGHRQSQVTESHRGVVCAECLVLLSGIPPRPSHAHYIGLALLQLRRIPLSTPEPSASASTSCIYELYSAHRLPTIAPRA